MVFLETCIHCVMYLFSFTTSVKPCQICWYCDATKGGFDLAHVFTNVHDSAAWRTTFLRNKPWDLDPYYCQLKGFQQRMLIPDLLHIFNLGIARDLIGSTIKSILKDQTVFQGHDINERFRLASESLRQFAKAHHHCLRLKKLSKKKICWANKTYPEFRGSGSDTHVVCVWLESLLQPHAGTCTLLWAGNRAMRVLYSNDGYFLDESEKRTLQVLGRLYVQCFLKVSYEGTQNHQLLLCVRPKGASAMCAKQYNECARRVQSRPVPVLNRVMTPIIGIISPQLLSSFRRFCRGLISPSLYLVTEPMLW